MNEGRLDNLTEHHRITASAATRRGIAFVALGSLGGLTALGSALEHGKLGGGEIISGTISAVLLYKARSSQNEVTEANRAANNLELLQLQQGQPIQQEVPQPES